MAFRTTVTDLLFKILNFVHRSIRRASGGRLLDRLGSMSVVELRTTGRNSGEQRTTMLTSPVHDDERVVLVASKGGDERDPDWYRNLVADPDVEITIDGAMAKMTARTATDEEQTKLWPEIVRTYKGYGRYQDKSERNIPVVICTPAE
jgi:deazaflavin-dependent oxidoreductase (nitroreductase family)